MPLVEAAQTREGLDAFLGRMSYTNDERIGQLAEVALAIPGLMNTFVEEAVRATALRLPNAPPGRKRQVTPDIKRHLVASVGKLNQEGVALGLACKRVAQKTGLGVRTVQRAWQERAKVHPVQTLLEACAFLETL